MPLTAEQKELNALKEQAAKTDSALAVLTKNMTEVVTRLKTTPQAGQPAPAHVFGAPWVRKGEDPMSSRGFSFMKMIGLITGACNPDQAKVEMDIHNRLSKACGGNAYNYSGAGLPGTPGGKFLAPLAPSFFEDSHNMDGMDRNFRTEMKQLVWAGTAGSDGDQATWIRKKMLAAQGYGQKDMSWLNEVTGGALVAPPEQGELIELLRNKEACVNAGARVVPLPPQGRMVYPRQTSASNTYWVGENAPIGASDLGTGEITLQAKKLAVLIKSPNELIRFASPAAEALFRDDMTKSLALGLDLACLEGLGGDTRPLGVINTQGVTQIQSSSQTANGDNIVGQDIYRFVAAVEEANAEFTGFVMRPKSLYKYMQLRSDSVAQGDNAGPFLFSLIREGGEGVKPKLAGYDVTTSTQVSQNRTKGTSTNLTYIVGGWWEQMLIGMFGAIEFAATTQGDTAFTRDQTWVRGILSADSQLRYPASFCWCDSLSTINL